MHSNSTQFMRISSAIALIRAPKRTPSIRSHIVIWSEADSINRLFFIHFNQTETNTQFREITMNTLGLSSIFCFHRKSNGNTKTTQMELLFLPISKKKKRMRKTKLNRNSKFIVRLSLITHVFFKSFFLFLFFAVNFKYIYFHFIFLFKKLLVL